MNQKPSQIVEKAVILATWMNLILRNPDDDDFGVRVTTDSNRMYFYALIGIRPESFVLEPYCVQKLVVAESNPRTLGFLDAYLKFETYLHFMGDNAGDSLTKAIAELLQAVDPTDRRRFLLWMAQSERPYSTLSHLAAAMNTAADRVLYQLYIQSFATQEDIASLISVSEIGMSEIAALVNERVQDKEVSFSAYNGNIVIYSSTPKTLTLYRIAPKFLS